MVIDPIVDTIIVVTFLVTALKTIYHNCIKIGKEKKDDNIIEKKEDIISGKKIILKSNQSLANLKLFYNDKDDEESNTPILSPVQKSYECFQCNKKLQGFYKKDFFAFDKEYCEKCWNKIHFKIINNRS